MKTKEIRNILGITVVFLAAMYLGGMAWTLGSLAAGALW